MDNNMEEMKGKEVEDVDNNMEEVKGKEVEDVENMNIDTRSY